MMENSFLLNIFTPTPGGSLAILLLGFSLGLKHALDADHLIAVSTIVGEKRGLMSSSVVGAFWGIGHTLSLLVVGVMVIALGIQLPGKVALALEFAVGIMLVGLGTRVLWQLARGGAIHSHLHAHGAIMHSHPHGHGYSRSPHDELHAAHEHDHHRHPFSIILKSMRNGLKGNSKSVLIGMVHGLAGSAGLMLLILATISSPPIAVLYIIFFGLGSIGGMLLMSALVGIPFLLSAHRSERTNRVFRGVSGLVSIGFGVFLAWEVGFVEGLFF
jgi:ABC-type nickel/cobalt efflux system permease component RcnA